MLSKKIFLLAILLTSCITSPHPQATNTLEQLIAANPHDRTIPFKAAERITHIMRQGAGVIYDEYCEHVMKKYIQGYKGNLTEIMCELVSFEEHKNNEFNLLLCMRLAHKYGINLDDYIYLNKGAVQTQVTPLFCAVHYQNVAATRVLMQYSANINKQVVYGGKQTTPYEHAQKIFAETEKNRCYTLFGIFMSRECVFIEKAYTTAKDIVETLDGKQSPFTYLYTPTTFGSGR